jgi:cysteine synthase A
MQNAWVNHAIKEIDADFQRSADTHLIRLALNDFPGISLYLKDESTHPSGSLKHRLARSLFLYGLCNLKTPVRFMPASEQLARELNGHYMDQFTFAERATDWRGNNNIADSIFRQMSREPHPVPRYLVMSAGTGGTSATLGRYIRYQGHNTELVVVDPENSVFYDYYQQRDTSVTAQCSSRIEGIGRPRAEPSFIPSVIDSMMQVPDAASVATLHWLEKVLGRKVGGSTGTNVWGALQLAKQMRENGETGSIVTLLCDSGERYLNTYFDENWIAKNIGDISVYAQQLEGLN